jgi:hypothetical protein
MTVRPRAGTGACTVESPSQLQAPAPALAAAAGAGRGDKAPQQGSTAQQEWEPGGYDLEIDVAAVSVRHVLSCLASWESLGLNILRAGLVASKQWLGRFCLYQSVSVCISLYQSVSAAALVSIGHLLCVLLRLMAWQAQAVSKAAEALS